MIDNSSSCNKICSKVFV